MKNIYISEIKLLNKNKILLKYIYFLFYNFENKLIILKILSL